uniref:Uncharacterized protein n=1 Tax=Romanomermis culicivorax TaxID=13658 RepID=A0A915IIL1_ROMCU
MTTIWIAIELSNSVPPPEVSTEMPVLIFSHAKVKNLVMIDDGTFANRKSEF